MRISTGELSARLTETLLQPDSEVNLASLPEEVQPFDLAQALEGMMEEDGRRVLMALAPDFAAEVLEHLGFFMQYRMLRHMPRGMARQILDEMSVDAAVDLIGAVHPRQAQILLGLLPPESVATIRSLMDYPEDSAGGLMTIDYVSVRQSMTVTQVLEHIRKVGREAETVTYIYVVNPAGLLIGVLSLKELILADPEDRVEDVMDENVVSVQATADQEEAAEIISEYDFIALPVVSADNKMLGIITIDDVIDVLQEEATEDALRMGATSVTWEPLAPSLFAAAWALAKPRLPWLSSLLFLELGSSFIVQKFSGFVTPGTAILLALFTVVMAGESGNAATQALAVVVRGLATGEIEARDTPKVVAREALVGLIAGFLTGGILLLTALWWQRDLRFGIAVGLALMINLFIAKVLGGLFPVLIQRLGIDPAVASGPFITTLTDNTSMLIYYGLAALILGTVA